MTKKKILLSCLGVAVLALAVFYQLNQSVPVEALRIRHGIIRQYVEDTGVVKSQGSQSVYLENGGRIAAIFVKEGDRVRPGDLLLRMDPTDIRLAEVAAQQAGIAFDTARRDWEKSEKLYRLGAISKKERDDSQAAYQTAAASRESAQLALGRQRQNLIVRAPLQGMVLQKMVDPNQVVATGDAAFVIGEPQRLEVEVDILADDVVKVQPGNAVTISGQAAGDAKRPGVVTKVAPMAKNIVSSLGVNQKRATVTIAFTGATGPLKPGYDVDVRITTRTRTGTVAVPLSAVFDLKGKNYVFIVEKERTRLRPVQTGIENDEAIEIRAGLKPGEWALTKPDNALKEGMKVKIQQPATAVEL
jgi:HlyD family secretion protein